MAEAAVDFGATVIQSVWITDIALHKTFCLIQILGGRIYLNSLQDVR